MPVSRKADFFLTYDSVYIIFEIKWVFLSSSQKGVKRSYTTNCENGNIVVWNGMIRLPKFGFFKMKQHRNIPDDYRLKAVTVSQNAGGKYFASILFEYLGRNC